MDIDSELMKSIRELRTEVASTRNYMEKRLDETCKSLTVIETQLLVKDKINETRFRRMVAVLSSAIGLVGLLGLFK